MKQYRLIKEFPGSPREGHIVEEYKESRLKNFYHSICEDEDCFSLNLYPSDNLTHYPKFWQKIINLEYKLISYIGSQTNDINKNVIWNISKFDYFPKNHLIPEPAWMIYSVERIKDNKIFKINDIIKHKKWNSIGKITSIRTNSINLELILFSIDWNIKNNVNDDSEAFIEDIEHYKKLTKTN